MTQYHRLAPQRQGKETKELRFKVMSEEEEKWAFCFLSSLLVSIYVKHRLTGSLVSKIKPVGAAGREPRPLATSQLALWAASSCCGLSLGGPASCLCHAGQGLGTSLLRPLGNPLPAEKEVWFDSFFGL